MPTLTRKQIEVLLEAELIVVDVLKWEPGSAGWVRAVVAVDNSHGLPLRLNLQVSTRLPGAYSYSLLNGGQTLRRLDVRGSHANNGACGSDERWVRRTHKHHYTDEHGDRCAYTPTDLPDTPGGLGTVAPGEYRRLFEAFCVECGIEVQTRWREPVRHEPPPTLDLGGGTA